MESVGGVAPPQVAPDTSRQHLDASKQHTHHSQVTGTFTDTPKRRVHSQKHHPHLQKN